MKTNTLLLLGVGGLAVYAFSQRQRSASAQSPAIAGPSLAEIQAGLVDWQTNGWGSFGDSWDWTYTPSPSASVNQRLGWNTGSLGSL